MPNVTRVAEAAEAVCGALHATDWEFMGEGNHGASTWFIRGESPKQARVEVLRSSLADYLLINVEWLVLTNPPSKGRETININIGESTQRQVKDSTERAVIKCLEIFRDVLQASGVADPKTVKRAVATEEGASDG